MINRLCQLKNLLRLTPFDVSTSAGRSQERHRRIALTALASAASRIITIATSFITVPITLNYLGTERYGLWMTISSVIAMMAFADFGIGNGLMNAVSEAHGKDDARAIKAHVANAMVILGIVSVIILGAFFSLYSFIHWGSFFNVRTPLAVREAGPALALFMICFAAGVPAGIVQRVQTGLQEGFISSLWLAGGSVIGLAATLLVIFFKGGLPWLVLALAGAPVAVLFVNAVTFFIVQRRDLAPDLLLISRPGMKRILHGGMLFFVLQLSVSLAYASDNLIIAKMLGAGAVAQFSVVSKLFEGVLIVISLTVAPLWPAYGEAKARGDRQWIKATLSRSMISTLLIVMGAAIVLVTLYKPLFALWIGSNHVISFALVAWYATWMVLKGLGATYSMFLNGMHILGLQLKVVTIFTIVSICLKLWFVSLYGLNGILAALVISYLITTVIPYALLNKKITAR
jgi:O-antigen/teichoic acid export membrane protein